MIDERPLEDDLHDLLATERRSPGAPPGARRRVAARLATSLASAGSPLSHLRRPTWQRVHMVAIGAAFAVGAAAGAVVALGVRDGRREAAPIVDVPRVGPVAMSTPTSVPSAALSPAPTPATSPTASAAPGTEEPAAAARPRRPPSPASNDGSSLAREQSVLDTARIGLGRDDGAAALAACDEHARRFPRGQLREEREAIAIQALVLLKHDEEARDRADRFARAYPTSALLPAVRDALGVGP
jgi:hypothetical protein